METNVRDLLNEMGMTDSIVFENPNYDSAIIGYDMVSNRIIYDYELMIKHLMENDGMEYDEAAEFIDYNTIRATPYAGELAPIILYNLKDEL
jgi:hypothetical protein